MKVCLLNPPLNFDISLGKLKNIGKLNVQIPLGIAYLASFLIKHDIDVKAIDAYAYQLSEREIIKQLLEEDIDLLGITCFTPTFPIACRIARLFKNEKPQSLIVLGGEHVSCLPQDSLKQSCADIVVRGEGEVTFLELIKQLESDKDLSAVKGITYKHNSDIINNPDRKVIKELDKLPIPLYSLLPMHLYTSPPQWLIDVPSYQIIVSRGCPFRCSFCSIKAMGKNRRVRSCQDVIKEIKLLINKYQAKQILFSDPIFPISKKEGINFSKSFIKSGINKSIKWATETRVDVVDEELLEWMYEAGCRILGFGIESGNQNILDSIGKGFKLEQAVNAVRLARKNKIKVYASFILGITGETYSSIRDTIDFAIKLNSDFVQFNLAVPYPGTEFYRHALREGRLNITDWGDYLNSSGLKDNLPVYYPKNIDGSKLRKLQKLAYRKYYLRPSFLLRSVFRKEPWPVLKQKFKTAQVLLSGFLN